MDNFEDLFPNQACLWGSYSSEGKSVRVARGTGSPTSGEPVPPPRGTSSPLTEMLTKNALALTVAKLNMLTEMRTKKNLGTSGWQI